MTLRYKIELFAVKLVEDHGIKVDRAEPLFLSLCQTTARILTQDKTVIYIVFINLIHKSIQYSIQFIRRKLNILAEITFDLLQKCRF